MDVKKPVVSIVIPAWDVERYVKEAVDSALSQTYRAVEVIVVDDCSTDDTRKVLQPYIGKKQITYIRQDNKGLAGARNTGIRASHGDYIALLDADDSFFPTKVEKQVAFLESHPEYGVCYSGLIHFSDTEPRIFYRHRYKYPSGNIFPLILKRQFINPVTVMVRRDVFTQYGLFDDSLRSAEDWDFWIRLGHAGVLFYHFPEPLAYYRIRQSGNLSSLEEEPELKKNAFDLFSRFGERLSREEREQYQFSKILGRHKLKVALAYLMVCKKEEALRFGRVPIYWRVVAKIVPRAAWQFVLKGTRRIKHRLLLKRLGAFPLRPAGLLEKYPGRA